jgi:hypothetical protein
VEKQRTAWRGRGPGLERLSLLHTRVERNGRRPWRSRFGRGLGVSLDFSKEPIAQDLVLLRQLLRTKVESDALGARVANRCHRTFGSRMGSVEDAARQRERTENQGEEREEERRSLRPEG